MEPIFIFEIRFEMIFVNSVSILENWILNGLNVILQFKHGFDGKNIFLCGIESGAEIRVEVDICI